MNFNLILGCAALTGLLYVVANAVYQYKTTPGTSILTAFGNSLTKLVAHVSAAIVLGWDGLAKLADYFNDPQLSDAIRNIIPDSIKPYAVIGVLALIIYARNRSLPKPNPTVTG
jgi:hypothetical protein